MGAKNTSQGLKGLLSKIGNSHGKNNIPPIEQSIVVFFKLSCSIMLMHEVVKKILLIT